MSKYLISQSYQEKEQTREGRGRRKRREEGGKRESGGKRRGRGEIGIPESTTVMESSFSLDVPAWASTVFNPFSTLLVCSAIPVT